MERKYASRVEAGKVLISCAQLDFNRVSDGICSFIVEYRRILIY
jgi:hypothetical protein